MNRIIFSLFLIVFLGVTVELRAQADRSYLPLSLSWLIPGGELDDSLDVQPGLGFSIGYQFAPDRNWRIGAKGTWMWSKLGVVDTNDYSQYSATFYQMLATVQWKVFKNGISPYVQVEGGLGFISIDEMIGNVPVRIDGSGAVRFSYGGSIGVLFPLSAQLEVDLSARLNNTLIASGYTLAGAHLGVVYQLGR